MEIKPTRNQQAVLDVNGNNQIVSASAGSGKTTIMIEKILNYIRDGKDVKNMLIVTFTTLAATEMKQKLAKELGNEIAREQDAKKKKYLTKQYFNIDMANISTIDKFCRDVVKRYFYIIDVDPNFNILSKNDITNLKNRSFDKAIDNALNINYDKTMELCLKLTDKRNLNNLKEFVFKLYDYANVKEDPNEIYDNAFSLYELPFTSSEIYKYYHGKLCTLASDILPKLNFCLENARDINSKNLLRDIPSLIDIINKITNSSNFVSDVFYEFKVAGYKGSGDAEQALVKEFKGLLQKWEKLRNKICDRFIFKDINKIELSIQNSKEMLTTLIELTKDFSNIYAKLKKDNNSYEFIDVEHFACEILTNEEMRKSIVNDIDYIFIDEYQDVNYLQEGLINKLSNGHNLFYVGDYKQSIYGFRQCSPEIFKSKVEFYGDAQNGVSQLLNENFRSDKNLLDFVNSVFCKVMTKENGDIDYENTSMLVSSNVYPTVNDYSAVNIAILDKLPNTSKKIEGVYDITCDDGYDGIGDADVQSDYVVNLIADLLQSEIYDPSLKTKRPVQYKDIAILSRDRGSVFKKVTNTLVANHIPCTLEQKNDIFSGMVQDYFNCLFKLVFDKKDDVSIVKIMTSFTDSLDNQELLNIKLKYPDTDYFYQALDLYVSQNNDDIANKIKNNMELIEEIKQMSMFSAVDEIISYVEKRKNIINYIYLQKDGQRYVTNFGKYLIAVKNSSFNQNILHYLQFIEEIDKSGSDKVSYGFGENSITCTTIHSSKGLEYPIVIIVAACESLNKKYDDMLICTDKGIGTYDFDSNTLVKRKTPIYNYLVDLFKKENYQEEKRLLYVALTRAKNHLFIVGTTNTDKLGENEDAESYMNMILSRFSKNEIENLKSLNRIRGVNYICELVARGEFDADAIEIEEKFTPSSLFKSRLKENFNFKYDDYSIDISFKNSVSEIMKHETEHVNFEPNNLKVDENSFLAANELGSLYHEALKYLDFDLINNKNDILLMLKNYFNDDMINQLDLDKLFKAVQLLKSKTLGCELIKEKEFIMKVSYSEIFPNSNNKDKVLVQGIVDLIVKSDNGNKIIDYKLTSSNNDDVLTQRYGKQLALYKLAVEKGFNIKVDECLLYLINQQRFIKINL